jgi:dUTPase
MEEPNFLELRIYTENNELKKRYQEVMTLHNYRYHTDNNQPYLGFPLFTPINDEVSPDGRTLVNLQIKCRMIRHTYTNTNINTNASPYYLYPSINISTLSLANSIGIINSGYMGDVNAIFDNNRQDPISIDIFSQLVQICAPSLEPFMVSLIDTMDDLLLI